MTSPPARSRGTRWAGKKCEISQDMSINQGKFGRHGLGWSEKWGQDGRDGPFLAPYAPIKCDRP